MKHEQLIIFDLDDTLVDTSDVYWRARTQFVNELAAQDLDPEEITELFEEIDSDHIKKFGFAPERYGRSMLATYEQILQRHNREAGPEILRVIESCGKAIVQSLPQLIDDAETLLAWASEHFELVLLTRGEFVLQMRKLEQAALSKYFSDVKVVADKDADTFRSVIKNAGYSPEKTWVIGDSIRTDINPGILAGAKCILYTYRHHSYHWRQEHGHAAVGSYYQADALKEVMSILRSPSSFKLISTSIENASHA
jgi:putative hydrolase of the HAD superfamily